MDNVVTTLADAPVAEGRRTTRERILATAEQLFLTHGFHGTSVHEIAESAGYTTGAIYRNFRGKDDVFVAVLDRRTARVLEEFRRFALESIGRGDDPATAMGAALARVMPEPAWHMVVYEFLARALRDEDLREQTASAFRAVTAVVREILGAVCSSSALSLDRIAPLITALIEGHIMVSGVDPGGWDDALFAEGVALLLKEDTA